MQTKSCYRTGECDPSFVRSCSHAQSLQVHSTQFFRPKSTGEHCDHYQRHTTEIDMHAELMLMMGAHK